MTAIARGESSWLTDIRPQFDRHEADGIVERLQELNANGKRVAVTGLEGLIRSPHGIVEYAVMKRLFESFPRATFVNGTALMYEVRVVKSEEEVAFIRKAVQIAEAAVQALSDGARPGVKDCTVYAGMVAAEVADGGELPFMLAWHATKAGTPYRRLTQATPNRIIQDGDLIYCQIEGKWQGYCSQMDQVVTVGKVPDLVRQMYQAQLEAFHATLAAMKPGATFGDMARACAGTAEGKPYEAKMILHGRGLGEDWPLITSQPSGDIATTELQENFVVDIKPGIEVEGRDMWGRFGDTVRVTSNGAERLGSRSPAFMNVG